MSRPVLLLHLGAGALPQIVPVVQVYGTWAPAVYVPPVIPGPELVIVGGIVIVNCDFSDFHLLLTENATLQFINVGDAGSDSDVVTIEVEKTGAFTLNPGANSTPISGTPYTGPESAGAVDVLGFKTLDRGGTWRYTVQKPVATAGGTVLSVSLAPSPAGATNAYDGTTASAPSVLVTATPAGGTAPITHKWTRVDTGGTNFVIDDDTLAAPTFSIATGTTVYSATQQWRDTVTDANAMTAQATDDVTLARTVPVPGSGVVTVSDHSISGVAYYNPDYDTSDAYIYVNAAGTLQWATDQLTVDAATGLYPGEWLGSGAAADVEVRATFTGGTTAPSGSGTGAWLNCGSNRSWYITRILRGAANTCTLLLEFRDASTHAALDSCTINLSADVN